MIYWSQIHINMHHQNTIYVVGISTRKSTIEWITLLNLARSRAWFNQIARKSNLGNSEESESHCLVIARDIDPSIEDERYLTWTKEATVITSDMHRGYVVPDGWDEYQFNRGATVTFDLSGPVLQLLVQKNQ